MELGSSWQQCRKPSRLGILTGAPTNMHNDEFGLACLVKEGEVICKLVDHYLERFLVI
jgi:hypothetical protein